AYAEFYFTSRLWPEFGADDLARALDEFRSRERRYGALPDAAAG
ncbi:MAG: undecaprenyl diphosphate synthase family protein, partial [Gemmatimonadota bacterium]|nr:undecaprenyl diphosphate synthase family protein [Gemmatimonadota bacterium]